MNWELDHVFFATANAGEVEQSLAEFGLMFTARRVHAGQGTANACALFDNAYFEVLGAHDREELRSDMVRPLGLDERIRWRETGACPIGLCFRPGDSNRNPSVWPFETWGYEPPCVSAGKAIPIVTPPIHFTEPLVFISTWPRSSEGGSIHRGARRTLTGVEVRRPPSSAPLSAGVGWFVKNSLFSLRNEPDHFLELEWNRGQDRESHRFAAAPIGVRW